MSEAIMLIEVRQERARLRLSGREMRVYAIHTDGREERTALVGADLVQIRPLVKRAYPHARARVRWINGTLTDLRGVEIGREMG